MVTYSLHSQLPSLSLERVPYPWTRRGENKPEIQCCRANFCIILLARTEAVNTSTEAVQEHETKCNRQADIHKLKHKRITA